MPSRQYEMELVRQAVAATEQEIFDEGMGGPDHESTIDDSGDREMEMDDRTDGMGKVSPADAYEDARGVGPAIPEDEQEVEWNAILEERDRLRKERDEWKAIASDNTQQRLAEQRQARDDFVTNNPVAAGDFIDRSAAAVQQQFQARVAQANAYGVDKYGDDYDAACNVLKALPEAQQQAYANEIFGAINIPDKVMEVAERITNGTGQRRWPASLNTNAPSGGRAAARRKGGGQSYEEMAGWDGMSGSYGGSGGDAVEERSIFESAW